MSRYWLTSKDKRDDPVRFAEAVESVCDVYLHALDLLKTGTHVVSTDEKTGIQALERLVPTLPARPGLLAKVEFEYIRHGTTCLIANFEVGTGKILSYALGSTRTEDDFCKSVESAVATDSGARWIFVADNLNTHLSESLVRMVVRLCGIDVPLGEKGKSGILLSRFTRKQFLEDTSHRVRFVFTPRHCSWLNQVEIWFSIIGRRLLRGSSFTSINELHERITSFIEHFNNVMAKPFRWTYTGRPLEA